MHPGMMYRWRHAQQSGGCGSHVGGGWGGGGFRGHPGHEEAWTASGDDLSGSAFGVRRPLRFLAFKLELTEEQVGQFARILDELKVERAQAEVDRRRTVSAFAEALEGETFADSKAKEGGDLRVKSAEKLREAVLSALGKLHAVLDGDQRKQLAYLIRTGALSI
jgi:hypothetical protein